MSGEQEKEMDSNQMNGAANVACVRADITTRRSANTPASTVICAAATEAQNVVEEEGETTGITTMAKVTDTKTQRVKTKDSDDQKARTKLTEKQLTDKEPRENLSESKQTETMEEKALLTQVLMIPIIGVIAIHPIMTGET